MKQWHAWFSLLGICALGSAVALSAGVVGVPTNLFASVLAPENEPSAPNPVLLLLEQLREDQRAVREDLGELGARQEATLSQQARLLRDEYRSLWASQSAQRDQELESLLDLGRWVLVIELTIGGVVLFAMAAVAWSLLRALQRPPPGAFRLPRPAVGQDEAGLPILPDAHLLQAIEQLEKRLLQLGEIASKPGAGVNRPGAPGTDSTGSLPGDFL